MFCPRCGRTVNDTANFCGGCGLPKSEILKYHQEQMTTPVITPVQEILPVNTDELDSTLSQLEMQLNDKPAVPVNDYTTEVADDTNTIDDVITPSDFVRQEIKAEQQAETFSRPQYTYTTPQYPVYQMPQDNSAGENHSDFTETDHNLSTVDYIWMMLIASVPVIGLIYLLYTAFASENPNKRSFARAVLIVGIFSCLIAAVFAMGLVISQLAFFY